MALVCAFLDLYVLVLFARAITSFFPASPGGTFARIQEVLARLTEPVLAPIRRVVPPIGIFDTSFLVLIIGVQIVRGIVCAGSTGLF